MSEKIGKTGKFPQGKLSSSDKGELKLSVGVYEGNVVLDFGTQVTWLAFPPEEAYRLAEAIIDYAQQALSFEHRN